MSEKADRRRIVKELKEEKALRDLVFQDLLRKPEGRAFIWWLLQIGKFGTQPMSQTPELTAFACGELNVGQTIFAALIEADPAGFLRMQQERNDGRTDPDPDSDAGPNSDSEPDTDT